jgi:hypothetical protein
VSTKEEEEEENGERETREELREYFRSYFTQTPDLPISLLSDLPVYSDPCFENGAS